MFDSTKVGDIVCEDCDNVRVVDVSVEGLEVENVVGGLDLARDGFVDFTVVGDGVGCSDGDEDGFEVSTLVGDNDGNEDGLIDSITVGDNDGNSDDILEGIDDDNKVGCLVGNDDGRAELVGFVGFRDGNVLGMPDGNRLIDGLVEGIKEGTEDGTLIF